MIIYQFSALSSKIIFIFINSGCGGKSGVFPFDNSNASVNMFDLRYQLRLHDLYDFTSVSYVSYEITMQHIRTLELLFSGTPQFRFNRKQNKVFIDIDWTRDVQVGDYVIIECYRSLNPSTITLTGTVSYTSGSNTVTGYSTTFDQQFLENDFITFNGVDSFQVDKIEAPTTLRIRGPMVNTAANVTATIKNINFSIPFFILNCLPVSVE